MRLFFVFTMFMVTFAIAPVVQADELKPEICGLLSRSLNVSNAVTYQAGVDAYGNAVVPADGRTGLGNVDVIKLPLTVDLARRVQSLSGSAFELKSQMGMIEIRNDGSVNYGDQDWTKQVKTLCGISHKEVIESATEANLSMPKTAPAKVQIQKPQPPKTMNVRKPEMREMIKVPKPQVNQPQAPQLKAPQMSDIRQPAATEMRRVPKPVPPIQEQVPQSMPNLLEDKMDAKQSLSRNVARVKTLSQGSENINGGSYKDFNYNE
jgi:hypothetical protein